MGGGFGVLRNWLEGPEVVLPDRIKKGVRWRVSEYVVKWGECIMCLEGGDLYDDGGKEKNGFAAICEELFYSFWKDTVFS